MYSLKHQAKLLRGLYAIWVVLLASMTIKILTVLKPNIPISDILVIIFGLIFITLLPYFVWLLSRPIKHLKEQAARKHLTFRVIVRQRIPYLSSFLYFIVFVCFLGVLLTYVILSPSRYSSVEMQTAYFILAIPEAIKYIIIYSLPGFILFYFLYIKLRKYRECIFLFSSDAFIIRGKVTKLKISVSQIKEVVCIDEKDLQGGLKFNLIVYLILRTSKTIRLTLHDYSEVDDFMEKLISYSSLNFKFFDYDADFEIDDFTQS